MNRFYVLFTNLLDEKGGELAVLHWLIIAVLVLALLALLKFMVGR